LHSRRYRSRHRANPREPHPVDRTCASDRTKAVATMPAPTGSDDRKYDRYRPRRLLERSGRDSVHRAGDRPSLSRTSAPYRRWRRPIERPDPKRVLAAIKRGKQTLESIHYFGHSALRLEARGTVRLQLGGASLVIIHNLAPNPTTKAATSGVIRSRPPSPSSPQ
jgi:hypothetical protein